jgi:hypothetical protein
MENKYIPPNKRNRQPKNNVNKNNLNLMTDAFPPLNKSNINVNVINTSKWNNHNLNISTNNNNNNNNLKISTNNKIKEKQQENLKLQTLNRNKLLSLTLEQYERDKINEELQEESPYWGVKNLLDPDSDYSEEEYDINKHDDSSNNSNDDNY